MIVSLLSSLFIIWFRNVDAGVPHCSDQVGCLTATVTKPDANVCEYEVCVTYDPNQAGCAKGETDSISHMCLQAGGEKTFCNTDESFCCDTCTEIPDADSDFYCNAGTISGECGGTVSCWKVAGGSTLMLFGMKDGGGQDKGCNSDISGTVSLGATIEGNDAAFTCSGSYNGGNVCDGKNTMECAWSIEIPSCGTAPTCPASDAEKLDKICNDVCDCGSGAMIPPVNPFEPEAYTPIQPNPNNFIETIAIPMSIYNGVYWLLVVQAVCAVLYVFKKYLLSTKSRHSGSGFYSVKHLDEVDEVNNA